MRLTQLKTFHRRPFHGVKQANTACPRALLRRNRSPDRHYRSSGLVIVLILLVVHRVSRARTLVRWGGSLARVRRTLTVLSRTLFLMFSPSLDNLNVFIKTLRWLYLPLRQCSTRVV